MQNLADSLQGLRKLTANLEANQYLDRTVAYAAQGFDKDEVKELLVLNGCNSEVATNLAERVIENLPNSFAENLKPVCYSDVRPVVQKAVLEAPKALLEAYFSNHVPLKYRKLAGRILLARDNPSDMYLNAIHEDLKPLVENIIIENNIIAENNKEAAFEVGDKENLEYELFGVWPVPLIQNQQHNYQATKKFIDKRVDLNLFNNEF